MFRPMRRARQQVSRETCEKVLTEGKRGVLALLGDEGYPYALPLNYVYEDGYLYFHCAREGHKMDAIARCPKASFCVMDGGFRKPGEWAWNVTSVIVFGRIAPVEDPRKREDICRRLWLKYAPSPEGLEEEMARFYGSVRCLALTVEHMTGKLVNES